MLDEENLLEVDINPNLLVFRDQQHNQQTTQGEKKQNSLQVLVLVLVWVPYFT